MGYRGGPFRPGMKMVKICLNVLDQFALNIPPEKDYNGRQSWECFWRPAFKVFA